MGENERGALVTCRAEHLHKRARVTLKTSSYVPSEGSLAAAGCLAEALLQRVLRTQSRKIYLVASVARPTEGHATRTPNKRLAGNSVRALKRLGGMKHKDLK